MKRYYDLHIHSCLSPCASDDMTPANIAGMAHIKGLSLIALTDHNSGRNLPAMAKAAAEYDLIFVPGIEVTTSEEVHVLTYFKDVGAALDFGETLYASLPNIPNRPDIFGNQFIMDENDAVAGTLKKLLLQAVPYTLDDVAEMAKAAGGCAVPAHINRDSFSVLANLGAMPHGLFPFAEVAENIPCPPLHERCHILHSSDAHDLGAVSEPVHALEGVSSAREFVDFVNSY